MDSILRSEACARYTGAINYPHTEQYTVFPLANQLHLPMNGVLKDNEPVITVDDYEDDQVLKHLKALYKGSLGITKKKKPRKPRTYPHIAYIQPKTQLTMPDADTLHYNTSVSSDGSAQDILSRNVSVSSDMPITRALEQFHLADPCYLNPPQTISGMCIEAQPEPWLQYVHTPQIDFNAHSMTQSHSLAGPQPLHIDEGSAVPLKITFTAPPKTMFHSRAKPVLIPVTMGEEQGHRQTGNSMKFDSSTLSNFATKNMVDTNEGCNKPKDNYKNNAKTRSKTPDRYCSTGTTPRLASASAEIVDRAGTTTSRMLVSTQELLETPHKTTDLSASITGDTLDFTTSPSQNDFSSELKDYLAEHITAPSPIELDLTYSPMHDTMKLQETVAETIVLDPHNVANSATLDDVHDRFTAIRHGSTVVNVHKSVEAVQNALSSAVGPELDSINKKMDSSIEKAALVRSTPKGLLPAKRAIGQTDLPNANNDTPRRKPLRSPTQLVCTPDPVVPAFRLVPSNPKRATYQLPGDAVSQRKRELFDAKRKAEAEEARRRREFKARPVRVATTPIQHRQKILGEQHKDPLMPIPSCNTTCMHRPKLSFTCPTNDHLSGSPNKISPCRSPIKGMKTVITTSSPRAKVTSMQRMKDFHGRSSKGRSQAEQEKQEREERAKFCREQAAEKNREAARRWAAKRAQS